MFPQRRQLNQELIQLQTFDREMRGFEKEDVAFVLKWTLVFLL